RVEHLGDVCGILVELRTIHAHQCLPPAHAARIPATCAGHITLTRADQVSRSRLPVARRRGGRDPQYRGGVAHSSSHSAQTPVLSVRSRFVDGLTPDAPAPFSGRLPTRSIDFLTQLPASGFSCWVRGRSGLVGIGRRLRLRARGADRFDDLARQWDALIAAAQVDDRVELLGSGLVGFSAIAFSSDSGWDSVIDVPEY